MQEDSGKKRTFYYQAGASSVGGVLTSPAPQQITPGASTLVPSVGGGCSSSRGGAEAVDSIISFGSSSAIGSGGEQESAGVRGESNPHWAMQVQSAVEALSLLSGKVQAAAVVTLASAKYPKNSNDEPEYSFAGSEITGLIIDGCEVIVTFNDKYDVCGEKSGDCLPQQICLVKSVTVKGKCPGIVKVDHHTLEISGVGRIIFGEGVKFPRRGPVQVCLMRIELDTSTPGPDGNKTRLESAGDSPTVGSLSVSAAVVGGTPVPPK